jgi:hypothetical protein
VREAVHEDRRQSIQDIESAEDISYGSCQSLLTENLNMRRVAAKFVPLLLTQDQKNRRLDICQDLKKQVENYADFLSKVITGDETWINGYDPETKQQSSQRKSPHSPRPKKARQVKSHAKSMLIVLLTKRESFIGNLFRKSRELTEIFILNIATGVANET